MMKNSLLLFVFVSALFVGGFVSSCKKYGDDAKFTLRTPMNRITGTWQITKYEVDGIDSLQYFTFYNNDQFVIDKEKITIEGSEYSFGWSGFQGKSKEGIFTDYPFYPIEKWIDTIIGVDTSFITRDSISFTDSWKVEHLTNKELVISQQFVYRVIIDTTQFISYNEHYTQNHKITCQKIKK